VRGLLALPVALAAFHGSVQPLSQQVRAEIIRNHYWHAGCPVSLTGLRLLTVTYLGFDKRPHTGQLVANRDAAWPLVRVFRRLYRVHFAIRQMSLAAAYGTQAASAPDASSGFDCRFAKPSPCPGSSGTGHWSEHAYGEAVDLNPIENPYVGCGRTRPPASIPYLNRARIRRGMVTSVVVRAFRMIGWDWGGSWTGTDKDYMHFSASGH
jgi:poly-gamma-glutamate synthesis protein (capsule biosynthesis protein)